PYYIAMTDSYMTEITFIAFLLLSCLFYMEGIKSSDNRWLWVGGIFASATFLTRQFGLVLPVAAIAWLVMRRNSSWGRVAAVAALPALAVAGYLVLQQSFGPTLSGSISRDELLDLVRNPGVWVTRAAHFLYLALFVPGLTVPLLGKVHGWKWAGPLSLGAAGGVFVLWQVKSRLVEQGRTTLDDLSYSWLKPAFANPVPLYCLGAVLTVWLLAGMAERAWPRLRVALRQRRVTGEAGFLALVALMLFAGTYIVSAGFLDRYWLPILPFIIAFALPPLRGARPARLLPVGIAMSALGLYGIIIHHDDWSALSAQWQAGDWVVARGVPYEKLENGSIWDGYYLYDEALQRLGSHDIAVIGRRYPPYAIIDPQYLVGSQDVAGYKEIQRFPFTTWLGASTEHQAIVLERLSP
ncbi:MAG: glycosyltransferase family 39 protein, partial [Chloroflexota bacterium]|nr:glycosyltransferase family 39 protein [Chloroflexota bacterium]